MKKLAIILGAILVFLIGAFFALNSYVYTEKQASPEEMAARFEPYRGTLSGTYLCLIARTAPAAGDVPCVPGILTEAGKQYVVDFSLMSQPEPQLAGGDRFSAAGLITPIERLSTDHWQAYDVEGIFSVTDSVERR